MRPWRLSSHLRLGLFDVQILMAICDIVLVRAVRLPGLAGVWTVWSGVVRLRVLRLRAKQAAKVR